MSEYSDLKQQLDELRANVIDNLKGGQGSGWAVNLMVGAGQKKPVNAAFEKFEDALEKFNNDTDITPKDQQEIQRARNTFDQELRGLIGRYVLNTQKNPNIKGELAEQQRNVLNATNKFIQGAEKTEPKQKADTQEKTEPKTTEKQNAPNTDAIAKAVAEIKNNVDGLGASKDFIADKIAKLEQNIAEFDKGNGKNAQAFLDNSNALTKQIETLLQTEIQAESSHNQVENRQEELDIQKSLVALRNANLGFQTENGLKALSGSDLDKSIASVKKETDSIVQEISQGANSQNTSSADAKTPHKDLSTQFADKANPLTSSPEFIKELEEERTALNNPDKSPKNDGNVTRIAPEQPVMTVDITSGKEVITPAKIGESLEIIYDTPPQQTTPEYIRKLEEGTLKENGTIVKTEPTPLLSANDTTTIVQKGDYLSKIVQDHYDDPNNPMTSAELLQMCKFIARHGNNDIDDINLIQPGQKIELPSEKLMAAYMDGTQTPESVAIATIETQFLQSELSRDTSLMQFGKTG